MLTLQEVIDSFEDPVKLRVSGLQRDGSSFLVKLDELLESDMISISKSESLFNYMVQVIMGVREAMISSVWLFVLLPLFCITI